MQQLFANLRQLKSTCIKNTTSKLFSHCIRPMCPENTQPRNTRLQGLYAITDNDSAASLLHKAEAVLSTGIALLQYRNKSTDFQSRLRDAHALSALCQRYQTPLIINDDITLAQTVAAAGVHLGKEDGTIANARKLLGSNALIGVSCYNSLERAIKAEQQGADYVALGSFFASPTKPDALNASVSLLHEAKKQLTLPICCIGGITLDNAPQLIAAGADMVAVISAVFAAKNVSETALAFNNLFVQSSLE